MPCINITIQGKPVNILVDTGSCMNITLEPTFKEIQPDVQLQPASNKVYAFGNNEPLVVAGKFTASIRYNQRETTTTFLVTCCSDTALLSYATASELDIIKISANNMSTRSDVIKEKYKDLFMGIGKLKGVQVKLHKDKSMAPITQPHRRIPYHMHARTKKELSRLLELDIIEPVGDEPTPWVLPIHVVQKPHNKEKIRICIDMRAANKAIKRERHITPTIDDVITELMVPKCFPPWI